MIGNSGALVLCTWPVFGSGWPVFSFLGCACRQVLSKFFMSTKYFSSKHYIKTSGIYLPWGQRNRAPTIFFTGCLNISSENKLILKFGFQLAGQKFSGLLPKSDQVLYALRGKIQPLTVGTHNCLSSWMSMTPNLYNKWYRRPIQKWSLNP